MFIKDLVRFLVPSSSESVTITLVIVAVVNDYGVINCTEIPRMPLAFYGHRD